MGGLEHAVEGRMRAERAHHGNFGGRVRRREEKTLRVAELPAAEEIEQRHAEDGQRGLLRDGRQAAAALGRKVVLVGRSMKKNTNIGRSLGHIKVPEGPPDERFIYLSDVLPTRIGINRSTSQ